jgi:hypothetical protein
MSIDYPIITSPPETLRVDHNHGLTLGDKSIRESVITSNEARGIVWMWEPPKPNASYCISADPCKGITGWNRHLRTRDDDKIDNAAIEVIKKSPTPGKPDVQVCEFFAPVDPYDLAPIINTLGRLYGGSQDDGQALCIIEVWPGPGLATQRELWEKFGYTNMFVWKYLDRPGMHFTTSFGWSSTRKSVRDLWIKGVRHITMDMLIINSPFLIEEMANCENNPETMRGAAIYGYHDDLVSATLLNLWALHDWTGQVENIRTESVSTLKKEPDWQRSDVSYEEMMEQWEDTMEEMLIN